MGGESIYGAPFEDEDLLREVDSEAYVQHPRLLFAYS